MRIIAHTFRALTGAYGLSVTGFLILRLLVDERWQVIALFNSLIHLLALGGVVLLVVCLLLREFRLSLLLMPALLAAGIWYTADFLPKETPPTTPDALQIITYNVLSWRSNPEAVAAVLRDSGADVIALQEVGQDHAAYFEAALSDIYPELRYVAGGDISGKMLFSRHPITGYETLETSNFTHQRVQINFNDQPVTVFNIHTVMPVPVRFDERNDEIALILAQAEQTDGAVIIAGDFNMTPQADPYDDITARYADAFTQAGQGFGFSFMLFDVPLARIDYVFYDDAAFSAAEARLLDIDTGSDHRPLRVILVPAA